MLAEIAEVAEQDDLFLLGGQLGDGEGNGDPVEDAFFLRFVREGLRKRRTLVPRVGVFRERTDGRHGVQRVGGLLGRYADPPRDLREPEVLALRREIEATVMRMSYLTKEYQFPEVRKYVNKLTNLYGYLNGAIAAAKSRARNRKEA